MERKKEKRMTFIRVPCNPHAVKKGGGYKATLDMVDERTSLQRKLILGGLSTWEPDVSPVIFALMETAPHNAGFVDVGAHVGTYAALVETVYARGVITVDAFEPTPAVADTAETIRNVNGLKFGIHRRALSSFIGEADLIICAESESSNSLTRGFRESSGCITVPVSTLDAALAELKIVPHLIKIDVETHEANVLLGALQTIAATRPWIVCEILPEQDRVSSERASEKTHDLYRALRAIQELGYTFYQAKSLHRYTLDEVMQYRKVSAPASPRDWILAPKAVDHEIWESITNWRMAVSACNWTHPVQTHEKYTYYDAEKVDERLQDHRWSVTAPGRNHVSGPRPKICGLGIAGGIVTLIQDGVEVASATVSKRRYWSIRLAEEWAPGWHTVSLRLASPDRGDAEYLTTRFKVRETLSPPAPRTPHASISPSEFRL
ncbi:FkbM family methyltransferase [Streptomyces vinaceus]